MKQLKFSYLFLASILFIIVLCQEGLISITG